MNYSFDKLYHWKSPAGGVYNKLNFLLSLSLLLSYTYNHA